MERRIYEKLLKWKNSRDRKPLILEGARQTGKTWILKEFGLREYDNLVYFNCDNNPELRELFSDFNMELLNMELEELKELDMEQFGFDTSDYSFDDGQLDGLFEDAEEKEKEPKQIQCPHCGQWFEA